MAFKVADLNKTGEIKIKFACSSYTASSYFKAQQLLNNIVQGTIGALVAALSDFYSTNMSCYDEASYSPEHFVLLLFR